MLCVAIFSQVFVVLIIFSDCDSAPDLGSAISVSLSQRYAARFSVSLLPNTVRLARVRVLYLRYYLSGKVLLIS